MKFFINVHILKKIVVIFSIIIAISFVSPKPVKASIGGELMEPICDLLVGLSDGILNVLHTAILKQDCTLLHINLNEDITQIFRIGVTVIAFAFAILIAAAVIGVGAAGIGFVVSHLLAQSVVVSSIATSAIVAGVVPILISGVYFGVKAYSLDMFENDVYVPMYSINAETLFTNKIPLFDVDFFSPSTEKVKYSLGKVRQYTDVVGPIAVNFSGVGDSDKQNAKSFNDELQKEIGMTAQQFMEGQTRLVENGNVFYYEREINGKKYRLVQDVTVNSQNTNALGSTSTWSLRTLTEIGGDSGEISGFSYQLKKPIEKWYYIFRLTAIVGMMSVLVYIGIRILISSTSTQSAKYRQLLGDWLVGMILLFTMHYIMVFSNKAVEQLTDVFGSINPSGNVVLIQSNNKVEQELNEYGIDIITDENEPISKEDEETNKKVYKYTDSTGSEYIQWHTDMLGTIRMEVQKNKNSGDAYIGYTLMFVIMVIYTLVFCWTYIRRVIYMAFLTLIAPLVALTYPIDKANDGQAQGFNYWFKEYMFNLLLQPMHLLIYTILISTAIELAQKSWIYTLVAMGFIITAEKIVRQMFNFSKARTPGVLAGPAGAAVAINGMGKLFGIGPKGGTSKGKSGYANNESDDGEAITSSGNKTKIRDGLAGFISESNSSQNIDEVKNKYKSHNSQVFDDKIISSSDEFERNNIDFTNDVGELNIDDEELKAKNEEYSRMLQKYNEQLLKGEITGNEYKDKVEQLRKQIFDEDSAENKNVGKSKRTLRLRMAISDAAGAYKDGISKKMAKAIQNAQFGRHAGRLAGGAAMGALTGMVGLAAGVTSGDPSKVAQYAGIGIAGGYKLGANSVDAASRALNVDGVDDTFERSYLGEEEYTKMKALQAQMEKAHNEKTIRIIQNKFKISREDAKAKAEEMAKAYMDEGINNVSDWVNIQKFQEKSKVIDAKGRKRSYTTNEAIQVHKIAKKYNIANKTGEKKKKEVSEQMMSDFKIKKSDAIRFYDMAKDYTNMKD